MNAKEPSGLAGMINDEAARDFFEKFKFLWVYVANGSYYTVRDFAGKKVLSMAFSHVTTTYNTKSYFVHFLSAPSV